MTYEEAKQFLEQIHSNNNLNEEDQEKVRLALKIIVSKSIIR